MHKYGNKLFAEYTFIPTFIVHIFVHSTDKYDQGMCRQDPQLDEDKYVDLE